MPMRGGGPAQAHKKLAGWVSHILGGPAPTHKKHKKTRGQPPGLFYKTIFYRVLPKACACLRYGVLITAPFSLQAPASTIPRSCQPK